MKILLLLAILTISSLCIVFFTFKKYTSEHNYAISRTNDYPPKIKQISKNWKRLDKNQFVPIKAYNKIGLDYFCTIEFVDSTYLVEHTSKYVGLFGYEALRFHTWQFIKMSTDTSYIPTFDENWNKYDFIYDSDTIYFMGLKIYDIEKWTFEKQIKKDKKLYKK